MSSSYSHTPLVAVVRSLGPVSPAKLSPDYGSSLSSLHPLESCFGICRLFSSYGFTERNTTSYGRFFYLDSLENWYYRILIVMTGNLQDAKIAVDSMSIWYVKYIVLEINIINVPEIFYNATFMLHITMEEIYSKHFHRQHVDKWSGDDDSTCFLRRDQV